MTAKEIRIEAAKIIANNEVAEEKDGIKTKRLIPLTPQDIAKEIGVTAETLVLALEKLHVTRKLANSKAAQESKPLFVTFDENDPLPKAYKRGFRFQDFMNNPR